MRETIVLTLNGEFADRLLAANEGMAVTGAWRRVELSTKDQRLARINNICEEVERETGKTFLIAAWHRRRYRRYELESAELLHMTILGEFGLAGETCGTEYDDSKACSKCGAEFVQRSPLILDVRRAPRKAEIAHGALHEWVVSERVAELMVGAGMKGFELQPVVHKAYYADDGIDLRKYVSGQELIHLAQSMNVEFGSPEFYSWLNRPDHREWLSRVTDEHLEAKRLRELWRPRKLGSWFQLLATSQPLPTLAPTRFGLSPFDNDVEQRHFCSSHQRGFRLLSELYVDKAMWDGSDVVRTAELVGGGSGQVYSIAIKRRPHPLLLISQRMWRLLRENKVSNFRVEIAHLV